MAHIIVVQSIQQAVSVLFVTRGWHLEILEELVHQLLDGGCR
jgi:hypothetical protein